MHSRKWSGTLCYVTKFSFVIFNCRRSVKSEMSDLKELGERKIKVGKKKEKKASRLLELFLPRRSLRRRFSEQFQRDSDLWLQRLRLSRNCCISPANFIRLNVVTIISNYDSSRIFSKRLDSSNCMYGNCTSLMCSVMEEW